MNKQKELKIILSLIIDDNINGKKQFFYFISTSVYSYLIDKEIFIDKNIIKDIVEKSLNIKFTNNKDPLFSYKNESTEIIFESETCDASLHLNILENYTPWKKDNKINPYGPQTIQSLNQIVIKTLFGRPCDEGIRSIVREKAYPNRIYDKKNKKNIIHGLLIDDNSSLAQLYINDICTLPSEKEAHIDFCVNYKRAETLIKSNNYNAIITDLRANGAADKRYESSGEYFYSLAQERKIPSLIITRESDWTLIQNADIRQKRSTSSVEIKEIIRDFRRIILNSKIQDMAEKYENKEAVKKAFKHMYYGSKTSYIFIGSDAKLKQISNDISKLFKIDVIEWPVNRPQKGAYILRVDIKKQLIKLKDIKNARLILIFFNRREDYRRSAKYIKSNLVAKV